MKNIKNFENFNKKINIPNKVYHKASPFLRKKIQKEGLIPNVGDSYSSHWYGTGEEDTLTPVIFAYDKDIQELDTTYDDDIWEIDTSKLKKEKWDKDKDEYMYDGFGSIVYSENIPKDAIKLIYKGTGKDN